MTTTAFLDHFDLASLDDLPRIEELLQVGLLGPARSTVPAAVRRTSCRDRPMPEDDG